MSSPPILCWNFFFFSLLSFFFFFKYLMFKLLVPTARRVESNHSPRQRKTQTLRRRRRRRRPKLDPLLRSRSSSSSSPWKLTFSSSLFDTHRQTKERMEGGRDVMVPFQLFHVPYSLFRVRDCGLLLLYNLLLCIV